MQYKKLKAVSGRVFYIYKRKKYLMRLYIKEGGLQIHPPRGFLGVCMVLARRKIIIRPRGFLGGEDLGVGGEKIATAKQIRAALKKV